MCIALLPENIVARSVCVPMFGVLFKQKQDLAGSENGRVIRWAADAPFESTAIQSIQSIVAGEAESGQRPIILNLGGPSQSMVDALGFETSTIIFANEFSRPFQNEPVMSHDSDERELYDDALVSGLNIPYGTSLRVIIAWDMFNYLSRRATISLMSHLNRYCIKGTILYAISWLTEMIPSHPGIFEITADNRIIYTSQSNDYINSPGHSARNLLDMMPSFQQHKLTISRSGMLEIIAEFNALAEAPNPKTIPAVELMNAQS